MITPVSNIERQQQILQLLERAKRISVATICEQFQVSEATARRDLDTLVESGKIQRVHGGAIPLEKAPPELPLLDRGQEEADAKLDIARAAAQLVNDDETVFLGSGTTVLEVARNLRSRNNLTVITNSLPVVNAFAELENISVICLGGMLRNSELSFIGHITEQALAEVRADKVFIGARAISLEHGLTHSYLPETLTDRAILNAGREVIVVADHTKFGRVAHSLLAPIDKIQTIVTDTGTPADFIEDLREHGLQVIVA
jgi:DeoR family transcriptional regulator, aga operon transcriptional repressor